MASYEYAVVVAGTELTYPNGSPTSAEAIKDAREALTEAGIPGDMAMIRRWRTGPGRLPRQGHGMLHRSYVVGPDGIVRRTDRTRGGSR